MCGCFRLPTCGCFDFPFTLSSLSVHGEFVLRHPMMPPCTKFHPMRDMRRDFKRQKHAIARQWATFLLDRLRDFVVVPSSAGGKFSFELNSQSTDECSTLDRYFHFHGLSSRPVSLLLPAPRGLTRLISFLGLVCVALLFFSAW